MPFRWTIFTGCCLCRESEVDALQLVKMCWCLLVSMLGSFVCTFGG